MGKGGGGDSGGRTRRPAGATPDPVPPTQDSPPVTDGPDTAGGGGGGGPTDPGLQCNHAFEIPLMSVNLGVAATVTVGMVLDIEAQLRGKFLVAVCKHPGTGMPIGSIAGIGRLDEFIQCLQAGMVYSAEIIGRNGANIRVRVQRSGP